MELLVSRLSVATSFALESVSSGVSTATSAVCLLPFP